MAVKKGRKTTKGWGKVSPDTRYEKRLIARRCGLKSFLRPNRRDPGRSSFPVISKYSHTCQYDCRGLRTAYSRAKQYKHRGVARKAIRLAKRVGCDWAEGD